MRYGLLGAIGAIAVGAALDQAIPHEGHAAGERPELAIPRSAGYDYDPPALGSYALPPIKAAADGRVLDEAGAERSLCRLLAGKVTVMAFSYTRCGDVCPQATMLLHELHGIASADPALRDELQLITISFDPENDTPAVMAMHAETLRETEGGAGWRFLTTSGKDALRPILAAYDQPIGLKTDPDDPLGPLAHQLRVYLIDGGAAIRNIYSVGFLDPRLVMTDVRTVLAEEQAPAHGRSRRSIAALVEEIVALPDDETLLPTVDVFVPTYDEDEPLLETTLTAARQLRYPEAKLNVYLLDDGATEQKRADRDPVKAGAASARHEQLQALCARVGAHYLAGGRAGRSSASSTRWRSRCSCCRRC